MDFRKIKKVELHRHMEGAVRLQTVIDVAPEAGVKLPSTDIRELRKHALVLDQMKDLRAVLAKFFLTQSCLATPSIIERVAYENCIDAFNDGIRVLELRYSPSFIAINHPDLTYDKIHEAICVGVARAEKELRGRLAVGLIAIITREQTMKEAEMTTDLAVANKDTFVGFDLAGNEDIFPPAIFKRLFRKAADAGLGITVHSGEIPGSQKMVKESILELNAKRIGHGIQIIHDESIMDLVKERNVVLEVCPWSNYLTQGVDKLENHPLPKLLKKGVPVTLNSDDPHIFGIDLTHEYKIAAEVLKMTPAEFDTMNATALKASFIHPAKAHAAWEKTD